jgi:hypothetical protein
MKDHSMTKRTMTLEHIDYSLSRWKTRLKRAMTAIDKLEKQRKRLVKASTVRASVPAHPTVDSETTLGAVPPSPIANSVVPCYKGVNCNWPACPAPCDGRPGTERSIDTSIPSFLRRSPNPVAEAIKVEQAETKRLKAQGRIAKMKAKQSGETRKMPLTGKAALAAIRGQ